MTSKCENCEMEEICQKYDIKAGASHPCEVFRPRNDKEDKKRGK
jgi:hypothetical protein